jgi:hypothetical protein
MLVHDCAPALDPLTDANECHHRSPTPHSDRGTLLLLSSCYSLRVVVSKTTDLVLQTCLHPAVSSSADRPALMLNHIDRCPSRQDLRHLKIFTQALPCLPPAASNLSMTCHLSQVEFASNHSKPSPSRSDEMTWPSSIMNIDMF